MLTLRRTESLELPGAGGGIQKHTGFFVWRPIAAARTALLRVDDVAQMLQPAARAELVRVIAELTQRRLEPEVDIVGIEREDELVVAVIVSLLLYFKSPKLPIRIHADPSRLDPATYQLFEQAMSKPPQLLKRLDQVTFARMHQLVGTQDHDGIAAFAPCLRFLDIIGDGDRRACHRLAKFVGVHKRNIQLMVTRRCHLRCTYCPIEKRDEDLDLGDARRALELLVNSENEQFRVDFTGGEPLLRKPWVRELVEVAHERARQAGKRDSFYLVTNAIELSEDFCRFLSDYDVELEISIDGAERCHNRHKMAVDQRLNPYRTLLGNFPQLDKYDLRYNAVLVFTPATFPSLRDNVEHILSLGFRNIAINYAIGYFWEAELIEQYVELVAEFVERYDMLEQGEDGPFFLKNLRYKSEPTVLNSELMLDTDGSLHLLSEWQFDKAHRLGAAPFGYSLDELSSIDDVIYTKAQVYYLLYEIYRSRTGEMLRIVHNSVETGLEVSRRLRERFGGQFAGSGS